MKSILSVYVTLMVLIMMSRPASVRSADDWRELELLLPESTNAVLAIDAEKLFASPMAKRNHWQDSDKKDFQQRSYWRRNLS
jgi:hypothetical protein